MGLIAALGPLVLKLFQWFFGGKQQAAGVEQGQAEAERDTATANAATETAIAQAEANAPKTDAEAMQRLKEHSA